MDAAGDEYDCLAASDEFRSFAVTNAGGSELAWIGQQFLNLFVFVESREIFGRADCHHHKWLAHRRLPKRLKLHAITRLIQCLKISDHLIPTRKLAIVAWDEAENFFRRRNVSVRCGTYSCRVDESGSCLTREQRQDNSYCKDDDKYAFTHRGVPGRGVVRAGEV